MPPWPTDRCLQNEGYIETNGSDRLSSGFEGHVSPADLEESESPYVQLSSGAAPTHVLRNGQ